jgi:hypothetical protein
MTNNINISLDIDNKKSTKEKQRSKPKNSHFGISSETRAKMAGKHISIILNTKKTNQGIDIQICHEDMDRSDLNAR